MILNIFTSEYRKLKRSLILYIHIIIFIFFPLILGLYYRNKVAYLGQNTIYTVFYETLAIASPIMISIVTCLVFDREEKAGKFKNWLSTPFNKVALLQIQLIFYWLLYFIEIIGVSLIFYLIIDFPIKTYILPKIILVSTLFSILGFSLYQITFIFSLKWNTSGALIIGIFGVILAFLGITSLFDNYWVLFPWTWQIRTVIFWQPNISKLILNISKIEYLVCLCLIFVISMLSIAICKKWEG